MTLSAVRSSRASLRALRYRVRVRGRSSSTSCTKEPGTRSFSAISGVESIWHWLAVAQHHGLPTRLTDWTYSPLDDWIRQHPRLCRRVLVPAELKWEVRDKLDQANINERTLLAGLDGLSRWLERYYYPRR